LRVERFGFGRVRARDVMVVVVGVLEEMEREEGTINKEFISCVITQFLTLLF
jgi:hypothetical protein